MRKFSILRSMVRKTNKFEYLFNTNHFLSQEELKLKFNKDLTQILKRVDITPSNKSIW